MKRVRTAFIAACALPISCLAQGQERLPVPEIISGKIAKGSTVSFEFPENVVSEFQIGDQVNEPYPFTVDPPVEGEFRWVSASSADFTITSDCKPGAEYRIEWRNAPGLRKTLRATDFTAKIDIFQSEDDLLEAVEDGDVFKGVRFLSHRASEDNPVVCLSFSHPVSKEDLEANVSLASFFQTDQARASRLMVEPVTHFGADSRWAYDFVAFPEDPLPQGESVSFAVQNALRDAIFDKPLNEGVAERIDVPEKVGDPNDGDGLYLEGDDLRFPTGKLLFNTKNGVSFSFSQGVGRGRVFLRIARISDEKMSELPVRVRVLNEVETIRFVEPYSIYLGNGNFVREEGPAGAGIKAVYEAGGRQRFVTGYSWDKYVDIKLGDKRARPNYIEAATPVVSPFGGRALAYRRNAGELHSYFMGELVDSFPLLFKGETSEGFELVHSQVFDPLQKAAIRTVNLGPDSGLGNGFYYVEAAWEREKGSANSRSREWSEKFWVYNSAVMQLCDAVVVEKYNKYYSDFMAFDLESGQVADLNPWEMEYSDWWRVAGDSGEHYMKEEAKSQAPNRKPNLLKSYVGDGLEGRSYDAFHSWDYHNFSFVDEDDTDTDENLVKEESPFHRRTAILTDRPVYRPGDDVAVYCVARYREDESEFYERIPELEKTCRIYATGSERWWSESGLRKEGYGDEIVADSNSASRTGCYSFLLKLPDDLEAGVYEVTVGDALVEIKVEEIRIPPFSVDVSATDAFGVDPLAKIHSTWRDGTPNANARVYWRAEWYSGGGPFGEEGFPLTSYAFSDDAPPALPGRDLAINWRGDQRGLFTGGFQDEQFSFAEGVGYTDENGILVIDASEGRIGQLPRRAEIFWRAEVIPASLLDDATLTEVGGAVSRYQRFRDAVGVRFVESRFGDGMGVEIRSWEGNGDESNGVPIKVEIFKVDIMTSQRDSGIVGGTGEAKTLTSFDNTPTFIPVTTESGETPFRVSFEPEGAGHYVVRATPVSEERGFTPVSEETVITGEGVARLVVHDDFSIRCFTDRTSYRVGDKAALTVTAPFAGTAWITVETDRVLYSRVEELELNTARFEIPISKDYFPNAFISVYLMRPTGEGSALERFGGCEIRVVDDERNLSPKISVGSEFRPEVPAKIGVSLENMPATEEPVEVALFAVDKDFLRAGNHEIPEFLASFFPERYLEVATLRGAHRILSTVDPGTINAKGESVGDAPAMLHSKLPLEKVDPLVCWYPHLNPSPDGKVEVEFETPEHPGVYEVFAVAVSGGNRFGIGKAEFAVKERLGVSPDIPPLLRKGDQVNFTVTLQNNEDSDRTVHLEFASALSSLSVEQASGNTFVVPAKQLMVVPFSLKASAVGDETLTLHYSFTSEDGLTSEGSLRKEIKIIRNSSLRSFIVKGESDRSGINLANVIEDGSVSRGVGFDLFVSKEPFALNLDQLLHETNASDLDLNDKCYSLIALSSLRRLAHFQPNSRDERRRLVDLLASEAGEVADEIFHSVSDIGALSTHQKVLVTWALLQAQDRRLQLAEFSLPEGWREESVEQVAITVHSLSKIYADSLSLASSWDQLEAIRQDLWLEYDNRLKDFPLVVAGLTNFEGGVEDRRKLQSRVRRLDRESRGKERSAIDQARLVYSKLVALADSMTRDEREASRAVISDLVNRWQDLDVETRTWALLAMEEFVEREIGRPQIEETLAGEPILPALGSAGGWSDLNFDDVSGVANFLFGEKWHYRLEGNEWIKLKDVPGEFSSAEARGDVLQVGRFILPLDSSASQVSVRNGQKFIVGFDLGSASGEFELLDPVPGGFLVDDSDESFSIARQIIESSFPGVSIAELVRSHTSGGFRNMILGQVESDRQIAFYVVEAHWSGQFSWPGAHLRELGGMERSGFCEGSTITIEASN